MLATLTLLTLAIVPRPSVWLVDRCERLENNHYHNDLGELLFTQIVAWDEDHCFFWRMNKCGDLQPERVNGGWVLRWCDQGQYREVWARSYAESWTQYDVETFDREHLPVEYRRKLKDKPCKPY